MAGALKREEGNDLFQIRVPYRLIKKGKQRLRELAVPRETSFNQGSALKGLRMPSPQASKEGGGVRVTPNWCSSWTNQMVAQ